MNLQTVSVRDIAHGGQGIGVLPSGKTVFVWNALPGETVEVRIIKKKRSYAEAIAETITIASPRRIAPTETNYLSTSPWQIMDYEYENELKQQICADVARQHGLELPTTAPVIAPLDPWQYRNKMEYSFWGNDDGLHLALHQRGSHFKQIVSGSRLALPAVDVAAQNVCAHLQAHGVRAGDLKTVVIRANQAGSAVAVLFVKDQQFPALALPDGLQGLRVYYSNPDSPASVASELLHDYGEPVLTDELLDTAFRYDGDSFFQVALPIFEQALQAIKTAVTADDIVDMYAGVGSIGLSVAQGQVQLVELDVATAAMAAVNAQASPLRTEVIETSAEASLDYITAQRPVIVDPPRAGLHPKVTQRLLETRPPQLVYLSCNPITQARDLQALQEQYHIDSFQVYNFFPRTPHIEALAVLTRRS